MKQQRKSTIIPNANIRPHQNLSFPKINLNNCHTSTFQSDWNNSYVIDYLTVTEILKEFEQKHFTGANEEPRESYK